MSKLLAGVAVSVVQAYIFLAIAWFWEVEPPLWGYLSVLPALILSGLMLGALGLVLSSFIRQLENFAGVMNFVIFPMFFASSALYPLWRVKEASLTLYWICQINPFSQATELIRFALYNKFNLLSAGIVLGFAVLLMLLAVYGYDPGRGLMARRGGGGE
jgi:ABC-2 type transport system permease protein